MTISDEVRNYLKTKPYILESMENGIVNFSSLSRTIQTRLRIRNHQAVKAAIIRYSARLSERKNSIEDSALSVLKDNRITLLDGISVIISNKKIEMENDAEIKLNPYYIYLTRKGMPKPKSGRIGSLVKVHDKCSAIVISSEQKLEAESGVIAFITSLLAEHNINIIELISCYTETIIVVRKSDALRSYQIISDVTNGT